MTSTQSMPTTARTTVPGSRLHAPASRLTVRGTSGPVAACRTWRTDERPDRAVAGSRTEHAAAAHVDLAAPGVLVFATPIKQPSTVLGPPTCSPPV